MSSPYTGFIRGALAAGVIGLGVAGCAAAVQEVRPPLSPNAREALARDLDAATRLQAVEAELAERRRVIHDLQFRSRTPPRTQLARLTAELRLLEYVPRIIEQERSTLRLMLQTDSMPSETRSDLIRGNRVWSEAGLYLGLTKATDSVWVRNRSFARFAVHAARSAQVSADSLDSIQRQLEIYERLVTESERLRATWDFFLASRDYTSLAEMERRDLEERRRREARNTAIRARNREEAETIAALIAAFGIAAAVSAILDSDHASPAQKAEVEPGMLANAKAAQQAICWARRERFQDGGANAVGYCVP